MDKRLAGLRDDIARLQADNDRLGERVDALEARPAPAPAPASAAPAQKSEGGADTSRPPLKIVKLVPNSAPTGEPSEGDVATDERVDAPGTRPVIRLYGRDSRDERRASRQNAAEDR
ncbi:MAG: hypothetical protein QM756_25215 [Polyangiaceae bacterium]